MQPSNPSEEEQKLKTDINWNIVSFGVIAACGLIMNILLGRFLGPEPLGVFNQALAIYIVLSQFSVFGLHYSALFNISKSTDNKLIGKNLTDCLLLSGTLSLGIIFLAYAYLILLHSDQNGSLYKGLSVILPGLLFFSLNKVCLSYFNGTRQMKLFAGLNSLRYLLVVIIIGVCLLKELDPFKVSLSLSLAELILFVVLLILIPKKILSFKSSLKDLKSHIKFGFKSFWSGTLIELNSKVDIIVLGFFVDSARIGLYSMVAFIFEGLMQIAVAFRNNYNPLITEYYHLKKFNELRELVKKGKMKFFKFAIALVVISALAYYPFVYFILDNLEFLGASWALGILLLGFLITAPYLPFNMILMQIGSPGTHSIFFMAVVFINIVLNFCFIPFFGIEGAAMGTALSLISSIVLLTLFTNKVSNSKLI